jgi:hypothetical protein
MAVEFAALDKGEGAGAAQRSGGIARSAPTRFQLEVSHANEEQLRFLIFKCGQCFRESVFGPTLWVRLCGIFDEPGESCGKIWCETTQLVMKDECRGLGDDQVVAVSKCLGKLGLRPFRQCIAESFQGGEFGLESAFCRHGTTGSGLRSCGHFSPARGAAPELQNRRMIFALESRRAGC